MTQQDIFKLLLLVLLGSNNQLSGEQEFNFGSLNELIIIALLLNATCSTTTNQEQNTAQNENTTF